jgi:hypothetical protein
MYSVLGSEIENMFNDHRGVPAMTWCPLAALLTTVGLGLIELVKSLLAIRVSKANS